MARWSLERKIITDINQKIIISKSENDLTKCQVDIQKSKKFEISG